MTSTFLSFTPPAINDGDFDFLLPGNTIEPLIQTYRKRCEEFAKVQEGHLWQAEQEFERKARPYRGLTFGHFIDATDPEAAFKAKLTEYQAIVEESEAYRVGERAQKRQRMYEALVEVHTSIVTRLTEYKDSLPLQRATYIRMQGD